MKTLVIGAGSIGKRHAKNLKAKGIMADIFDVVEEAATTLAKETGGNAFTDLGQAFNTHPELAFVCSPNSYHIEHARLALEAECHVFIEKPLGVTMEGVEELLKFAKKAGKVVACGFNLRFDKGLIAAKALIKKGAIGKVTSILSVAGQYLPDQRPHTDYRQGYGARKDLGGGVILDGIHELDYQHWLLGSPKKIVCYADSLSGLEIETEDNAAILLEYAEGVKGIVQMDYVKRAYQRFCHIVGTEGTITWDFVTGEVQHFSNRKWKTIREKVEDWQAMVDQLYIDELDDFLSKVESGHVDVKALEEAISVLRTALTAKRSVAEGAVINLS